MPSSKPSVPKKSEKAVDRIDPNVDNLQRARSPSSSTKRRKAPGLTEWADQAAQEAVDNLNRLPHEKEAAKPAEQRKSA